MCLFAKRRNMRGGNSRWLLLWMIIAAASSIIATLPNYATAVEKYCYADDNNPYVYFGMKSSYELISQNRTYRPISKCVPVKLWMLARHGTRYGGKELLKNMKTATNLRDKIVRHYERNLGDMCAKDIENLKKWIYNLTDVLEYDLASQGRDEIKQHAVRMKESFPALFNVSFSNTHYEFQSTTEKRAVDSAIAFAQGLFGSSNGSFQFPSPPQNDLLLHTELMCQKWLNLVRNPRTFNEYALFKNGSHVKNVIYRVSQRLGFQNNITADEVFLMYEICAFETAWYPSTKSSFCAPFTADDLKVMEYLDDLRYYYRNGYGNEKINVNLGCSLVRDIIQKFSKSKNGPDSSSPAVTLYFSHMGPTLQFLTALGIRKDNQRLTHDNFEDVKDRRWRTSKMVPFASNFVAILYRCEDSPNDKVMFYLNEDVVSLPGCSSDGLCALDFVVNKYSSTVDPNSCNLDHCDNNQASSSSRLRQSLIAIMIASFFAYPMLLR